MDKMLQWLTRRFPLKPTLQKRCTNCDSYYAGHLDRRVNIMKCAKGHRLLADEDLTIEHRLTAAPVDRTVLVTTSGWHDGGRKRGDAMLGRSDCPDWQRRKFRLDLGNPEYD
jgi:hypothetical protein